MKYYQQKLFLAQLDKSDAIIGKVERWQAHQKGVLHRGFTVILTYQDKIILQHRKHPAFDGYFDATFSSHQVYKNGRLQTDLEAIYEALEREWKIKTNELAEEPTFLEKCYYKAKDPQSIYTEYEIDYIYKVGLKRLPIPNFDFAYGFSLLDKNLIIHHKSPITKLLAPWVKKMIKGRFFR